MKQQPSYADSSINPYISPQVQNMSVQRMQHNVGMDNFPGHPDAYSAQEENPYKSSKLEGQWQWDRDTPNLSNQMPSHAYNEGQGANGTRSYYQSQMLDPKLTLENQANKEPRGQPYEQDMEIGYEDNSSAMSLEGLERKFLDEIMKLVKEHGDAEDAENTRHREKIIEINTRHEEKLLALRTQQANRREEFLRKESQARLNQYHQPGMGRHSNPAMQDTHSYGGAGVTAIGGEAHRAYAAGQFEYRDQPQFLGPGRPRGADGRVPYPSARVYSTGPRYY